MTMRDRIREWEARHACSIWWGVGAWTLTLYGGALILAQLVR